MPSEDLRLHKDDVGTVGLHETFASPRLATHFASYKVAVHDKDTEEYTTLWDTPHTVLSCVSHELAE